MGSIKSIKTTNFKFDVISVTDGMAQVRISALLGDDKNGALLFRFDNLSRTKPVAMPVGDIYNQVLSYEERLGQLLTLRKPAA